MWFLWIVLMIAAAGYFIYRADKKIKAKFEDKFNPHEWELPRSVELPAETKPQLVAMPVAAVKLGYTKKASVLNDIQHPIFSALQQALAGDYVLLANVNVADVLSVNANNNALAAQVASKNLAARQFDFVVCEKTQLGAVCAIVLGESLEPLLVSACEDAQLPLARFKVQASYDVAVIRASLLKALGVAELTPASTYESALHIVDAPVVASAAVEKVLEEKNPARKSEFTAAGIELELCPECSAVMVKRKAKNGASAGKLFWICSTYPQCRGMLPTK